MQLIEGLAVLISIILLLFCCHVLPSPNALLLGCVAFLLWVVQMLNYIVWVSACQNDIISNTSPHAVEVFIDICCVA